jgi:hypothetical protein
MAGLADLVCVVLVVTFVVLFVRKTFRRTPPDDREPPEDRLVTASLDSPRKPNPSSIKLDLPKDED